jgi:IS5 family transposase
MLKTYHIVHGGDAFRVGDLVKTPMGRHAVLTNKRVDGLFDARYIVAMGHGEQTTLDPRHLEHAEGTR